MNSPPYGIRRPDGGDDRLPRQDHHVADLLEELPCGGCRAIGGAANHVPPPLPLDAERERRAPPRRSEHYATSRITRKPPTGRPARGRSPARSWAGACGSVAASEGEEVRMMPRGAAIAAALLAATVASGCGGGERQDVERAGRAPITVQVTRARLPAPAGSRRDRAVLRRRPQPRDRDGPERRDDRRRLRQPGRACPGAADPQRPIWIINAGPIGGRTAYVNTWALGPLKPGQIADVHLVGDLDRARHAHAQLPRRRRPQRQRPRRHAGRTASPRAPSPSASPAARARPRSTRRRAPSSTAPSSPPERSPSRRSPRRGARLRVVRRRPRASAPWRHGTPPDGGVRPPTGARDRRG